MNASNKRRINEKKYGVYSREAFIRVITVFTLIERKAALEDIITFNVG